MGTRSTISIESSNGAVSTVYCHWDGYLSGVGRTLNRSYSSREQAEQLIAGGDMSSLYDELDRVEYYAADVDDISIQKCRTFNQYECTLGMADFDYVMRADGVWYVRAGGDFTPLADELYNEAAANPQ